MLRMNFPDRKEIRQKEAIARQEARNKRTNIQQLERLDRAFGVGMGATKERAKLLK